MEQGPSTEAKIHSASPETSHILWNPKIHYCVHESPPLFPTLSQLHPVHKLSPYFSKFHCSTVFTSTLESSQWSFPFRFSDQNFVHISHFSHNS